MDKKRRKQIEKRINGLEAQKEKHKQKILTMEGRKDTTHEYWQKEIDIVNDSNFSLLLCRFLSSKGAQKWGNKSVLCYRMQDEIDELRRDLN
jgi:uncharacterized protein YcaQ